MNPPSALQGAMGRERKPFTYTPGGLDLSEIKSERMAKRLMRNAMNQGVPELPPQQPQSPSTPTTPIAVPNFNCLPVQVFPSFNLPANPKSLLRTRSTPDKFREPVTPKQSPHQNVNSVKPSGMEQLRETLGNNSLLFSPANSKNNNISFNNNSRSSELNNNIPYSVYNEYNAPPSSNSFERQKYESEAFNASNLPEICYDVEFCQTAPRYSNGTEIPKYEEPSKNVPRITLDQENISETIKPKENTENLASDFTIQPISERIPVPIEISAPVPTKPNEDIEGTDDDDQTVKVVKKQVKKKVESESKTQNGDHNGDAEAEMTVKLPSKKSAAKTETKVEVVKKTLPDGSIEETKTTITKTTVDGTTSIKTKTETTIIPKAEEEEEEYEEEEEESGEVIVQEAEKNDTTVVVKKQEKTENSETKTISKEIVEEKKVEKPVEKLEVKQQEEEEDDEEEVEEEIEEEEEVKKEAKQEVKQEIQKVTEEVKQEVKEQELKKEIKEEVKEEDEPEEEEEEEEEEDIEEVVVKSETKKENTESPKKEELETKEETEVEEEYEEAEEPENKPEPKPEPKTETKTIDEPSRETKDEKEDDDESEYTEEEYESDKEEPPKQSEIPNSVSAPVPAPAAAPTQAQTVEPEAPKGETEKVEQIPEKREEPKEQPAPQLEQKVPLREPSIPLEKVEDVEIKPIGAASETISKTHTERTEIISSLPDKPSGTLSTQTEYNRIENIVTVNRTTKTLDHSYEQITQQGVPTVKTYFAPGRERVSPTPQPAKPYQPIYTPPHPQPERRHSLLLERLSTERQMPSEIYQKSYQQQYHNQPYEQQRQWSQEPQSEIVNERNVKPSSITNQQWYQQSRKENVIYNNITPSTPAAPSQQWSQPQPQVQTQPQYQTSYTDNILHDSSKISTSTNTYQQNSYPSYAPAPAPAPTPAPTNWASQNTESNFSNVNNTQSNQYSFLNKGSSENYQNTSQQYSSSYVPPPWEQDPNYVAPQQQTQTYYQPQPAANTFSPSAKPGWKPAPPASKFSKPVANAYIPPAPNQSFVKPASNAPESTHHHGSKTYYSEYERRYITVPESTYIPVDAKFQPQPDPSPQYYYDNNEPNEPVEHQWRKELREFTEKSQTQTLKQTQTQAPAQVQVSIQQPHQTEFTSVNPPWEEDPKYAKVPSVSYTPTPSWSQTLRPQSWRERSFESEYVGSNEWSKTNSLNRSRPLSTYATSNVEVAPERARGVSVDRYNPNKYQTPLTIPYDSEHGPVQAHTLDPNPAAHRGYHNPNVPAYHARTSAEPREQQPSGIPTPRNWGDSRTTPIQSRSFKYLQWITGTED